MSKLLLLSLAFTFLVTTSCQQKTTTEATEENTEAEVTTTPDFMAELTFGTDYKFYVNVASTDSSRRLTIDPKGPTEDQEPIQKMVDARVIDAEAGDISQDTYPEVVIVLQDEKGYGSVIVYSSKAGKNFSEVPVESLSANPKAEKGYKGGDMFVIESGTLVRRFPTYLETDDVNVGPTGPFRQIKYKMVDGRDSKLLKMDEVIEYNAQ